MVQCLRYTDDLEAVIGNIIDIIGTLHLYILDCRDKGDEQGKQCDKKLRGQRHDSIANQISRRLMRSTIPVGRRGAPSKVRGLMGREVKLVLPLHQEAQV